MTAAAPQPATDGPAGPYPNVYTLTQDEHRYLTLQGFIRFIGFSEQKRTVFYKKITETGRHHVLFASRGQAVVEVQSPDKRTVVFTLSSANGKDLTPLALVDCAGRACP